MNQVNLFLDKLHPFSFFELSRPHAKSMKSLSPDGLYLIEIDRVLRPGGYWILSGPPIRWKKYYKGWERTQEDLKQEQDAIADVESAFAGRRSSRKVILQSGKSP